MKKYIYYLLLPFVALIVTSCSDDDKLPAVTPADRGTVTDNEGNVYEWVRIGDLLWTTTNANNGPDVWESTYYNGSEWLPVYCNDYGKVPSSRKKYMNETYRPKYGNPMNYASAVASAPEGWRLPSDEDWKNLERCLGMTDVDNMGARGDGQAFRMQEGAGGTELALLPGGGFILEPVLGWIRLVIRFEEVYGYYWTSTVDPGYIDEETVYFRKFLVGQGSVWRGCTSGQQCMSVRWCRNATND